MRDDFKSAESLVAVLNAAIVNDKLNGKIAGGLLRDFCFMTGEDSEQYRERLHARIRLGNWYWDDIALHRAWPGESGSEVLERLVNQYVRSGLLTVPVGGSILNMFLSRVGPSYI